MILIFAVQNLPPLKKKYFEHGLTHTPASVAALKALAGNLRATRKHRNLSQLNLAQFVGCSVSIIKHIENARSFPSLPVYLGICRCLGLPRPPLT